MENAGADRMAYMTINDKNSKLPIVDKKLPKIMYKGDTAHHHVV